MSRPGSTGTQYLTRGSGTGKFVYSRALPPDVAPYVVGEIDQPWARKKARLTRKKVIKVSLKTGDLPTAHKRFIQVAARVDNLIEKGLKLARQSAYSPQNPTMLASLDAQQIGVLAQQIHHDIVAADDARWNRQAPSEGLEALLLRLVDKLAPDRRYSAQEVADLAQRTLDRQAQRALTDRRLSSVESGFDEFEADLDPAGFTQMIAASGSGMPLSTSAQQMEALKEASHVATAPGLVDEVLARNGLAIARDHPDRLHAAPELLRAQRRGNCYDNAVAESFFNLLKRERIRRKVYRTRDEARADVFDYIEMFYNPTRKHARNGMLSPVEFERRHKARAEGF